jgi:uncharacterized protein (DUF305 family)
MPRASMTLIAATLFLAAIAASGQTPSVVQPGAPGQASKTLPANQPPAALPKPSKADVEFMQCMIMHHSQAVEMTQLLKTRSHDPEVQSLGKKIDISQTDEMGWMKRWLQENGKPISTMADMPGMDMSSMMPAMPEFDHLFLTGMIQHHTGALTMVKELFSTPGAAQDPWLFEFTSDVTNTQQAEIDIMRHMLAKEKQ